MQTLNSSFGGERIIYPQTLADAAFHLSLSATLAHSRENPCFSSLSAAFLPPTLWRPELSLTFTHGKEEDWEGEGRVGRSEAQGGILRGLLLL